MLDGTLSAAMASETGTAGPFDDRLATQLIHQRIVVLQGRRADSVAMFATG